MTQHTLIIDLDSTQQTLLEMGFLVLPEHQDNRTWSIRCEDPENCDGWQECFESHVCEHGRDASRGYDEDSESPGICPGGGPDDACDCWAGLEDFEFHGIMHTYRWGYGWTIKYPGCVVAAARDFTDAPDYWESKPRGEYEIRDDWDDEQLTLYFPDEPPPWKKHLR